tara:strand:- start:202 stop:471 length:270 start_codon:yes stop_codon:yes gene_type:complete
MELKMNSKNEHLINNIPNNFITRWIVKKINKSMNKSNSRYFLTRRYRKPVLKDNGKYVSYRSDGGCRKQDGSVFSLYLRVRRNTNGSYY